MGMLNTVGLKNLSSLEGKGHRERRKIISSSFHFDYLKAILPKIGSIAKNAYDKMEEKQGLTNVEVLNPLTEIAGQVVCSMFLGADI